jgi:hypothetical protein
VVSNVTSVSVTEIAVTEEFADPKAVSIKTSVPAGHQKYTMAPDNDPAP